MTFRFEFLPSGADHVCGDWRLVVDDSVIEDYGGYRDYLDYFMLNCFQSMNQLRAEGFTRLRPMEPMRELEFTLIGSDVRVTAFVTEPAVKGKRRSWASTRAGETIVPLSDLIEGVIESAETLLREFDGKDKAWFYVMNQRGRGIEWTYLNPPEMRKWMDWARKWVEEIKAE